ncbi:adenylate/guanylate cyclase domain-containing protein [Rhizobium sp. BK176]|uniref:adenylate/guanylate cyclase domain-containing protein n=1 Tax=Rhizobium sp. BK176 TaxID=2587071 RepID=UPI002168C7F6|nr:adenylate/guanylate cyclase domain-containing protein [Rhizobium sp. BK176]
MNNLVPQDEPSQTQASLLDWLMRTGAVRNVESVDLFGAFCERVAKLVPVERVAMQLENLHPLYYGYCLHWEPFNPPFEIARAHSFAESEAFRTSPYTAALQSGAFLRVKLDTETPAALPLLRDLQLRGFTDFMADFLATDERMPPGVSWATRRSGGFSDTDLATLLALTPHCCTVFRAHAERRKTEMVLKTYLGSQAGGEVFAGQTQRGKVQGMAAVVLLTDMRGFTEATMLLCENDVLELLNRYFEAVTDAVSQAGGEVLKFIGDAVLSVFPVGSNRTAADRCAAAVNAIANARVALNNCSQAPDFVAALTIGTVAYGNIGGRERLDFTVVGAAVNLASRLEALAKECGVAVVMSADVAACLPLFRTKSLGWHRLKGFENPIEAFALEARS